MLIYFYIVNQLIKLHKDTTNTNQLYLDYSALVTKINTKADSTAIPTIPTHNLNAVNIFNTDSLLFFFLI